MHAPSYRSAEDPDVWTGLEELIAKLKDKLLMCRRVAAERSPFVIRQKDVLLRREPPEKAAPLMFFPVDGRHQDIETKSKPPANPEA